MDDMMAEEEDESEAATNAATNGDDKERPVSLKKEESAASVVMSDALDSSVNTHGLLSTCMKEAAKGGLNQFTKMNSKIQEVVSQNNFLLLEKVWDMEEGCQKQLKEKDEQIKRFQNLLGNKDDQMKKITSKIEAGSEYDQKAKKYFGENEDFHKKRVEEVSTRRTGS